MTIEALLAAMDRAGIQESDLDTFFASIVSNNRIAQLKQKLHSVDEEKAKVTEPYRNARIEINTLVQAEELKLRAAAGK